MSDERESVRTAGFAAGHTTVSGYLRERWQAVQSGELGSIPIIVGLLGIVLVFGTLEDQFLSARNFTNLLLQMAPISFLAIGIIFILLIADGEIVTIDLSVAFVAATGGAVLVLLQRPGDPGWPWWLCIIAALALTTMIGLLHALIITKLGVPSFIMTLAGFLIWSGVVLWLTTDFTDAGTIRIQDQTLVDIANKFLTDDWMGWAIGGRGRRRLRDLPTRQLPVPPGPGPGCHTDADRHRPDRRSRCRDPHCGLRRQP